MAHPLTLLARFATRRPKTTLGLALALAAGCLGLAGARLELRSSNIDLIDPAAPAVRSFLEVANQLGTPNVLVVVLEGESETALEQAVTLLGPQLRAVNGVRGVVDRIEADAAILDDYGLEEFLRSYDHRLYFILVQPHDPLSRADAIAPMIRDVRETIDAAGLDASGITAGLTGLPQYAIDDRDTVRRDVTTLSALSLVLVAVLFVVGFRTTRRPLLVVVALLFGVSWTLGAAALWPGHLTLLSASFASILVGLGVDYGIHIVARIEEWVAAGLEESRAATRAVEALAASLTTAALTSAAVFYAMLATGFRGFAELGFIAGSGILLCLVANVTVLPALLIVLRARAPAATERAGERWSRALGMLHSRPFAVALLLFGLVSLALPRARFESNYLALQPRDSAAVRWERKMIERSDLSPQFAIFLVDSARDAQELTDRLLEEDLVGEVHSLVELETLEQDGFAVPQDLVRSLQTEDGGYAVYAYPEEDLWADQDGAFVERMLAIDPQVTGMPILGSFMIESSLRAMRRTAWLSAALLLLVVGLSFRDLRSTLLALVPVSLAAAVLPTVMRWLGLHWNPIDVMAVPVILGIAVDDGVHLVHRFHHERGDIAKALAGSGRAIVLTSATTLAAFGSLSLAQHRGLASFAMVLSLGVILALVFTLVVLPPLLTWSRGATVTSTRTGNAAVRTAPLSPNRHPSRTLRQVVKRQRPNPVK